MERKINGIVITNDIFTRGESTAKNSRSHGKYNDITHARFLLPSYEKEASISYRIKRCGFCCNDKNHGEHIKKCVLE